MSENEILTAITHLSKNDKVLSTIIKKYGTCNLRPHKQYFNDLLKAIIGQQLSIKAAAAIEKRFFDQFGIKPKPEHIVSTDNNIFRSIGISNAKTNYIKDLCRKYISGELNLKNLNKKNNEEIINELTKVKGIGIWSAHMFLIFTLGRLNILAYSDFGVRKAIMLNYRLRKLPDEKKVFQIAKKNNWSPFNSIACLYMWKTLDG